MNYNFLAEAYANLERSVLDNICKSWGVSGIYAFQDDVYWNKSANETVKVGKLVLKQNLCESYSSMEYAPKKTKKTASQELYTITLTFTPMIFWKDYKEFKKLAEFYIATGETSNDDIVDIIEQLAYGETTQKQAVDDIIDILSGGEHKKPLETKQLDLL